MYTIENLEVHTEANRLKTVRSTFLIDFSAQRIIEQQMSGTGP